MRPVVQDVQEWALQSAVGLHQQGVLRCPQQQHHIKQSQPRNQVYIGRQVGLFTTEQHKREHVNGGHIHGCHHSYVDHPDHLDKSYFRRSVFCIVECVIFVRDAADDKAAHILSGVLQVKSEGSAVQEVLKGGEWVYSGGAGRLPRHQSRQKIMIDINIPRCNT